MDRNENEKPHERAEWYAKSINSCGRNWKAALKILNEMETEKGGCDIIAINAAIRSCGKGGNSKKALELLYALDGSSMDSKPNIITINTVISTLAKSCDWESAVNVFRLLSSKWNYIKPNVITYNSVIAAYATVTKVEEILDLLSEMEQCNIKPNLISYTCAVQGCGDDDEVALNLIETMIAKNIKPDINIINQALKCYNKSGDWRSALELFVNIDVKFGLAPDVGSANALLKTFKQQHRPREAMYILRSMIDRKNFNIGQGDNIGKAGCDVSKNIEYACDLLSTTLPDNESFEIAIECLDAGNFREEAAQLMEIASRVSRLDYLTNNIMESEKPSKTKFKFNMFKNKIWLSNGSINLRGCSIEISRTVLCCLINDLRHEIRPPTSIFLFTDSVQNANEIIATLVSLNGPRNSLSSSKNVSSSSRVHIKESDVIRWLSTKWGRDFNSIQL